MPEKIDSYYKLPKGTPVMWVPTSGQPYKGESPFISWHEDSEMIFSLGHHKQNKFEKALADRGYYGLYIEPLEGFPSIRSVWFLPKRVRKLGS